MRRVFLARLAAGDLDDIDAWSRSRWPRRARSFMDRLETRIMALSENGELAGDHPHVGPPLRRVLHGPYEVFFLLTDAEVRVIAVLHGSRDLPAILAERGYG